MRGGWVLDREHLYGAAGVEPSDIDFVETYDDYPVMSVIQLEDLGFCRKGEGPEFIRRHSFSTDGTFPINTSGGQLSVGQAGCAAGFSRTRRVHPAAGGPQFGEPGRGRALRNRGGIRHDHLRPRIVFGSGHSQPGRRMIPLPPGFGRERRSV